MVNDSSSWVNCNKILPGNYQECLAPLIIINGLEL